MGIFGKSAASVCVSRLSVEDPRNMHGLALCLQSSPVFSERDTSK